MSFFLPMATKLEERSSEDVLFMQIMIEGVASLQRGDHPSIVKEKLQAFLAPALARGVLVFSVEYPWLKKRKKS